MHTVAIVPPPEDSPDAPAGVLTGSEDGFVLRATVRGAGALAAFSDPAEVGAHVGGAAVRAIALVPDVPGGGLMLPPGPAEPDAASPPPLSYTLLTVGAKEVLQAWRVSWERAGSGSGAHPAAAPNSAAASGVRGWRLRTSLVAARGSLAKPGHAEWQSGCGFVAASVETDQRYMDVAGFAPVDGGGAIALAASSEGAVTAMALERGESNRNRVEERADALNASKSHSKSHSKSKSHWRAFAALRFHDRPVLAVAVAGVRVAGGGVAVVAATGATDGALAIWDVTRATEERRNESDASEVSRNQQPLLGLRALAPAHVTRGAHQSGVNGIAVRAVAGLTNWFVAASGGDDQVARAEVFSFEQGLGRVVSVARVAVAFAHGSAIKGVWLGPGTVPGTLTLATTSHDQRARVWTVATERRDGDATTGTVAMTPAAGAFAECPEPEGLDGFVDARGRARIAVCGRGVQMFELE